MPHPLEHTSASEPLGPEEADRLAEVMTAFTAGSRLRLLYALLEHERPVDELAEVAGLTPTAASQQLRVLRQLGAVAVRRDGRHAFYRLGDHHIADLLSAIRYSAEHRTSAGAGAEGVRTAGAATSPASASTKSR